MGTTNCLFMKMSETFLVLPTVFPHIKKFQAFSNQFSSFYFWLNEPFSCCHFFGFIRTEVRRGKDRKQNGDFVMLPRKISLNEIFFPVYHLPQAKIFFPLFFFSLDFLSEMNNYFRPSSRFFEREPWSVKPLWTTCLQLR